MNTRRISLLASIACAVALSTGCAEDGGRDEDGHGVVRVRLAWSDAQQTDPFPGTAYITWQVAYDRTSDCLLQFYLATDTAYQQDGVEGAPIWDAWESESRVCQKDYNGNSPDCEVAPGSLQQFLSGDDPDDPTISGNMREALVLNDDDVTGRELAIGPIPQEKLLPSSCKPKVEFSSPSIKGYNANDEQIWEVVGVKDNELVTDQGAAGLAEISRRD